MPNLQQTTFISELIGKIESELYFKKYYGNERRQLIEFKKRFYTSFSSLSQCNQKESGDTIEDIFSEYCRLIQRDKLKFQDMIDGLL